MNCKIILAAAALLATQSFAIIGIGGHYAPSFGNKLKGMSTPVQIADNVALKHDGFSGTMQGFGFKIWVDFLPFIDVEATMNFQVGSYDATLYVTDPNTKEVRDIPLEIELGGTPYGKASPKFVAMRGDLSITYPWTSLPIIRPYIGGGLTYNLNTFVLNPKFTSALIDNAVENMIHEIAEIDKNDPEAVQKASETSKNLGDTMKKKIQDAALDEALNTSIGGHILVGVRAKLPIIPIAAYVNGKLYFGGDFPSEMDPGMFALEAGVGLAF